jgi:hypothetical protein
MTRRSRHAGEDLVEDLTQRCPACAAREAHVHHHRKEAR